MPKAANVFVPQTYRILHKMLLAPLPHCLLHAKLLWDMFSNFLFHIILYQVVQYYSPEPKGTKVHDWLRDEFIDGCNLFLTFCEHVASTDLSHEKVPHIVLKSSLQQNNILICEGCTGSLPFPKELCQPVSPSRSGNPDAGLLIVQYVVIFESLVVSCDLQPAHSGFHFNYILP